MAISQEDWDEAGAARLEGYCAFNKLFMPVFNWIPPLLQHPLVETFRALGLEDVLVQLRKVLELQAEFWLHRI